MNSKILTPILITAIIIAFFVFWVLIYFYIIGHLKKPGSVQKTAWSFLLKLHELT